MRIGMICHPSIGGSGFLASQLGLALANEDHEVVMITYETPFLLRDDKTGNMTVELVDVPSYPLFRNLPYTSALISKIIQEHNENPFDLLHVHYAIPHALAGYMTREIASIPYVVTLHGSDVHLLGIDPAFKISTSFAIQKANGVSAVSKFLADIARDQMDVTRPISVIPNFVDCGRYKPRILQQNYFRKENELTITHVSNFRPVKRTLALVEAFSEVSKKIPNARLFLVGDGPERTLASRLAEKLGIKKKVRIMGVRLDIPDILNETDVFALPSQIEGCPLSILEAMSSSVPVVATRVGGIPEILDDGKEGYLVSTENNKELAERLIELLSNSKLRESMGKQGRLRVCKNLNIKNVLPQYLELFNKCCK